MPLLKKAGVTSLFSSSLPIPLHETLNLASHIDQSLDTGMPHIGREAGEEVLIDEEMVSQAIGDLLPDDEEELLAGIAEGFDMLDLTHAPEENDDFDLFSSVGGLEMDGDTQDSFRMYVNNSTGRVGFFRNASAFHGPSNGHGPVVGKRPYGEHPSRTLFVGNINSNVKDSEIRALFEQYGAIRTLYTSCKYRGFVMISYYDIRAAQSAMRALHNKPLHCIKLDIHFSILKENPSDKDINQGTLVVFNVDASVSNDELHQIFGQYGEVKEIRETPHKHHHKFIEFYDVRAAETALRALNRSDIAGNGIKLEPSCPGRARRSLIQQLTQEELEQEETHPYQQASSPASGHASAWGHFGNLVENGPSRALHYSLRKLCLGMNKQPLPGLFVTLPHSSSVHAGAIGCHLGKTSEIDISLSGPTGHGATAVPAHHTHSLPEYSNVIVPVYSSPAHVSIRGIMSSHGPHNVSEGQSTTNGVSLFQHAPGVIGIPSSEPLSHLSLGPSSLPGHHFTWGNSSPYQQNTLPVMWSTPAMRHSFNPGRHAQHQPYGFAGTRGHLVHAFFPSHRHRIGSAPSGGPSVLERQCGYFAESPDSPFFGPGSLGPNGVPRNTGASMMNINSVHSIINSGGLGTIGGFEGGTCPSFGSCHRMHRLQTNGIPISGTSDGLANRGRIRRSESSATQADSKKQYQLDIDRILCGEDTRTTLMIKNIPNKYTSKMLLAAIDENHRRTYDFVYLPIDFKNKCNVGYAFINMTSPTHIIPIYQAFNGKKWEKFNSEKVASLAYARIQGKAALIAHFQNSSLMNEDKRCRPILFNSEGPESDKQE